MAGRGGNHGEQHSALVASCTQYLKWQHAWVLKVWGGPLQRSGVPDILAAIEGRLICAEIKTGVAVLSAAQESEKRVLEEAGALYVVVRDLDTLEEAIVGAGLGQRLLVKGGG